MAIRPARPHRGAAETAADRLLPEGATAARAGAPAAAEACRAGEARWATRWDLRPRRRRGRPSRPRGDRASSRAEAVATERALATAPFQGTAEAHLAAAATRPPQAI